MASTNSSSTNTTTTTTTTSSKPSQQQLIKLNIGGFKYTTSHSTLCSVSNFFSNLIGNPQHFKPVLDEEGAYFIDRDGKYFEPILEYLRTSELNIPSHLSKTAVLREANFYGIEIRQLFADVVFDNTSFILSNTAQQIRFDGVYLSKSNGFYVFATNGHGFSSAVNSEFVWKTEYPIIQLRFDNVKSKVDYKEGTIFRTLRREFLWDDGMNVCMCSVCCMYMCENLLFPLLFIFQFTFVFSFISLTGHLYDFEGNKLLFRPTGEFLTGVSYKAKEEGLKMSASEIVTHVLFNTPRNSNGKNDGNNSSNNNSNNNNNTSLPKVSLLWQGNWMVASYAECPVYDLNAIEFRFVFTTATIQCIPCMSFVLLRKSGTTQFVRFDMVSNV